MEDVRSSLRPGPLMQVVSMSIESEYNVIGVYGKVYAKYVDSYGKNVVHDIYKREQDMVELLGPSRALTISGPDCKCYPYEAYMPLGEGSPLGKGSLIVDLFDEMDNVFVQGCVDLGDIKVENEYDHVKPLFFQGEKGCLAIHCHVIPLGIFSRVEVSIYRKEGSEKDNEKYYSMDLNGKIVARYGNNFGNYSSMESTLFEKQSHEFERVANDIRSLPLTLPLSRCWVSLPAYSSLCIDLELLEFGTGRKIISECVELLPRQGLMTGDSFVIDDLTVEVCVYWYSPSPRGPWCSPRPQGPSKGGHKNEGSSSALVMSEDKRDEMDVDGEDESSSDDDSNDSLSIPSPSWTLHSHKRKPLPSSAIDFFSVFIGRQSKALKLYGSIEVLCADYHLFHVFKRDKNDALLLSEHMKSISILDDGSRIFEEGDWLEIKVDLKDVEGGLAIKGDVNWDSSVLGSPSWHDAQLCSLIQGQNGFAVLHYSILDTAVEANLKVFWKLKVGLDEVPPKVHGCFVAQYGCFDYSSEYNRDHYRIILLNKLQDDALHLSGDGRLPLSRCRVIVPSYSSLFLDLDLSIGVLDQKVSCVKEIPIGQGSTIVETNEFSICIEIDWHEVK